MAELFTTEAGRNLLASLRQIFEQKRIYHRKHRLIIFVCGGGIGRGDKSLRKKFVNWASRNLPDFICLLAEDALSFTFDRERQQFVNLAKFESILADVADCILVFPESAGSFAETGFFANSKLIRQKTLIVNPLRLQTTESFLNLGPIETIANSSLLRPTLWLKANDDFSDIGNRLKDRVKWPEHRERLQYTTFGRFNFRQKMLFVFELLRLLRVAELATLRHAIKECFDVNPQYQELQHLLSILLAAKLINRHDELFMTVSGVQLIEIEHFEIDRTLAQVQYFYKNNSKELYDAVRRSR